MKYLHTKTTLLFMSILLGIFQSTYAGQPAKTLTSNAAIEQAILVHINDYRKQKGLSPLKMDSKIVHEAQNHSLDMANHAMPFGHKYFTSRIDRLHAKIKNSNAGAENVAYNYKDAQDVVKNWLLSPGHKRNIDGHYDLTGIGVARDKQGKLYFTQIFLRTGASSQYAQRRPLSLFFRRG